MIQAQNREGTRVPPESEAWGGHIQGEAEEQGQLETRAWLCPIWSRSPLCPLPVLTYGPDLEAQATAKPTHPTSQSRSEKMGGSLQLPAVRKSRTWPQI